MTHAGFSCNVASEGAPLPHVWEELVGSGHAPLALRADWQAQLTRCARELGMRRVRFHDLFADEIGILVLHQGRKIWSFANADAIVDFLLGIGMKPFLELSFMPGCIARGDQRVMHYQANVTPPLETGDWTELVDRLVRHWVGRYGIAEVRTWMFEVWNEPNIPSFWSGDQAAYFQLFAATLRTIKAIDPAIPVGGPASAACGWIDEFVDFCRTNRLAVDFVSTHLYPTDALGSGAQDTVSELADSPRDVMRSKAAWVRKRVPGEQAVWFTEWSSSSNWQDRLHDEAFAAAFAARTVLENTGLVDAYSWWTFSDLFEENWFSSAPFHGGFGLLTLQGVAKPVYRAFELLHGLGDTLLRTRGTHPTVDVYPTRDARGDLAILLVNQDRPRHPIRAERVDVELTHCRPPAAGAIVRRIDGRHANPRAVWTALGEPAYPSAAQLGLLHAASACVPEPLAVEFADGAIRFTLELPAQGVACVAIGLQPAAS